MTIIFLQKMFYSSVTETEWSAVLFHNIKMNYILVYRYYSLYITYDKHLRVNLEWVMTDLQPSRGQKMSGNVKFWFWSKRYGKRVISLHGQKFMKGYHSYDDQLKMIQFLIRYGQLLTADIKCTDHLSEARHIRACVFRSYAST